MSTRIVLAFGGSRDAADAIARLRAAIGGEVVTVTLDLGQGSDLEQARDVAIAAGAARAHVVDARREFAGEVIGPALAAGAFGAEAGPLAVAASRPLIAKHLAAVARMEQATLVAHGACGQDGVRIEQLLADVSPELTVMAAADTRAAVTPVIDNNLWGRTLTCGPDGDTWEVPPARLFTRTTEPAACQAQPAVVEIGIERGRPVAVNGVPMEPEELIEVVDTIAGDHGVGRIDRATIRGGVAHRELVEAPAAAVLELAMRDLSDAMLDRTLVALRRQLAPVYASLIQEGRWYSQARVALDAFTDASVQQLTGTVRLLLVRGACRVVGRQLTARVRPGCAVVATV